ncbi:MAG TPA: sigma-70 family RNA polymerase sigma factor [Gammaproteobacteria bacterium]|nr:sigma-70 family RNA polymerase sigma factor [Gammaproteobacteria bacterium]
MTRRITVSESGSMERLVIQAQRGSAVALEQLLRLWYPKLLGSARRVVRSEDAAKDVVQEALLKLAQNLASLRNPEAFGKWSRQILYRCCFAHLRREKKDRERAGEIDGLAMVAPDADPELLAMRGESELVEAVDSLGRTSREIVRMHYFIGLSLREIASRVRISEGAVKARLHRARNQLRERLIPGPLITIRREPSGNAR